MTGETDLVALVGSRICHDLISPIGAIGNGIELLGMTGGGEGPEVTLIAQSVENASARIRYYRVAFGAAGNRDMAPSEITATIADYTRGGRLVVGWSPSGPVARADVRRIFLAIMCLESALSFGGTVEVLSARSGWIVTGQGERLRVEPEVWALFNPPLGAVSVSELGSARVHFLLLARHLESAGKRLALRHEEKRIEMYL